MILYLKEDITKQQTQPSSGTRVRRVGETGKTGGTDRTSQCTAIQRQLDNLPNILQNKQLTDNLILQIAD